MEGVAAHLRFGVAHRAPLSWKAIMGAMSCPSSARAASTRRFGEGRQDRREHVRQARRARRPPCIRDAARRAAAADPARRSPRAGACESAAVHAAPRAPRPRQNKTRRPSPGRRVLVCARVVLSVPPPLPGAVCVIAKRRQGATERALSGGSIRCPPGAVSNRRRAIRRSRCPSRVLRSPPPRPPAAAGSQSAGPRSTVTGRACRSCSCLR